MSKFYWMLMRRMLAAALIVFLVMIAADLGSPAFLAFHNAHRLIVDISAWMLGAALVFGLAPIRRLKS